MKKALLTFVLLVSSSFFVYAQGSVVGDGGLGGAGTQTPCSENGQFGYLNAQGVCDVSGAGNAGSGGLGGSGTVGGTMINTTPIIAIISLAQKIVSRLVPFLIGLGLLAFFWFLVLFIWKGSDSPEERKKSLGGMGWSILALFVMVSIWGLVGFIGSVVGINQGGSMPGFKLPGEQ